MGGTMLRAVGRTAVAVSLVAALASCGSDNRMADAVMNPRPQVDAVQVVDEPEPVVTAAPTTVAPTTVVETTTTVVVTVPETTVPPTTVPPTTLPAEPQVPIAPPADTRGQEPVIELGSIEIPRIGVAASMFEGIRLTTLDRGPGHWPGTAMPGQAGNVVVAGHRTSHSKPFRHLEQLQPGDEVIFNTADGRFVYHVTGTEIVYPDAIHIVDQTPDATATLFACHPVGSTKQRIVVHLALTV